MVAISLFLVILLTFVVTIKFLGESRYLNSPPETVYLDLGSQHVQASLSIVASPEPTAEEPAAEPEVTDG